MKPCLLRLYTSTKNSLLFVYFYQHWYNRLSWNGLQGGVFRKRRWYIEINNGKYALWKIIVLKDLLLEQKSWKYYYINKKYSKNYITISIMRYHSKRRYDREKSTRVQLDMSLNLKVGEWKQPWKNVLTWEKEGRDFNRVLVKGTADLQLLWKYLL